MKGLDDLKKLRLEGLRPKSVFVNLVTAHDEWPALGCWGHLTVELLPEDSLVGIDFRPLVGLPVIVEDRTDGPAERFRKLVKAVSEVETETLVMAVRKDDAMTLHIRTEAGTVSHAV